MTDWSPDISPGVAIAALGPHLRALLEVDYPRFSQLELTRRRAALAAVAGDAEVDAILVCGQSRADTGVPWLCGWPTAASAMIVFTPGERDALFVQHFGHVPVARGFARDADVQWGGASPIASVKAELARRAARRVGVMGPLSYDEHRALASDLGVVDLGPAYVQLRQIKSEEEIGWLRIGAALSDEAIAALRREMQPDMSERDLWSIAERAYVGEGGTTATLGFGTTAMERPDCCGARPFPSTRRLAPGDVVMADISTAFWDYAGQVSRTFVIAAEPTPLYAALYAAADAAFAAVAAAVRDGATMHELLAASGVIADAGFTTCDDLVHGYGGGYFPPVIGSASRPAAELPTLTLKQGMTIVVQPNVVTHDGAAGVQVGELLLVTADGFERLHSAPRELFRIG